MPDSAAHTHPVPPYGTAIQQAVASGNLSEMKRVAALAEDHIRSHGDISAALEILRIEIARLEAK